MGSGHRRAAPRPAVPPRGSRQLRHRRLPLPVSVLPRLALARQLRRRVVLGGGVEPGFFLGVKLLQGSRGAAVSPAAGARPVSVTHIPARGRWGAFRSPASVSPRPCQAGQPPGSCQCPLRGSGVPVGKEWGASAARGATGAPRAGSAASRRPRAAAAGSLRDSARGWHHPRGHRGGQRHVVPALGGGLGPPCRALGRSCAHPPGVLPGPGPGAVPASPFSR